METNKKKKYEKPQLQEVKLVPEEAVLAACKNNARTRGSCTGVNRCNAATGRTTYGS